MQQTRRRVCIRRPREARGLPTPRLRELTAQKRRLRGATQLPRPSCIPGTLQRGCRIERLWATPSREGCHVHRCAQTRAATGGAGCRVAGRQAGPAHFQTLRVFGPAELSGRGVRSSRLALHARSFVTALWQRPGPGLSSPALWDASGAVSGRSPCAAASLAASVGLPALRPCSRSTSCFWGSAAASSAARSPSLGRARPFLRRRARPEEPGVLIPGPGPYLSPARACVPMHAGPLSLGIGLVHK